MSNYVVWNLFHSATGSKVSERLFVNRQFYLTYGV